MFRALVIVTVIIVLALAPTQTRSQASNQLDERAKNVATPQEQSWKQVDEINKETDKTTWRYQQAKQGNVQPAQKSGYRVIKSSAHSPYKKPSPPKKKTTEKKK